ncbi:hypothetical protein ACV1DD_04985, partial [Aeromonas veronii]
QKRVIDQNGRSPSSTENSKIRCGMTDRVHAYAWLSLAATEGMPNAVRARDELEVVMTKLEIKQAQKLSEYWSLLQTTR